MFIEPQPEVGGYVCVLPSGEDHAVGGPVTWVGSAGEAVMYDSFGYNRIVIAHENTIVAFSFGGVWVLNDSFHMPNNTRLWMYVDQMSILRNFIVDWGHKIK